MQLLAKCYTAAVLLVTATFAAGQCHLREIDICAAASAGISKVPATEIEVNKYCQLGNEAKDCFQNYTIKCATPIQRELLHFATEGARLTAEKFCTKGDELREGYLKHAPCLARTQPDGKRCLTDVQAGLEKVEEVAFKDRITAACCVYTRYNKCFSDIVEGKCGTEAIRYGQIVLRLSTSNLLDVVCQGFDTNPKCSTLLPPPGSKPKGNSKSIISKLFNAYASS
ncbi:hypothetical protein BIW11_00195 [Tropilaelaps mercedesae]|uniref:Uncharacterized protein n=1 Tax=Tropilaelaps mercedesae TaxID=418985 RepID=A0A1V9Y0A1_9ACAR|nr:hypothetical protein BIW11_00195 [Tropilaelaps mercedesae]